MRFSAAAATLAALALAPGALAKGYKLADNYVGQGFLSGFSHQAIPDPTQGRVTYVDQATALKHNLTYAHGDTFVMRADHTTKLSASGPGRMSVRVKSNKAYTNHVAVFDIRHMPQGCGTWPAAWEVAENDWPARGEVDIVEGVNDAGPNSVTLHTTPGCSMPGNRAMQGTAKQADCNTAVNGNAGCGVGLRSPLSYGPAFNKAGGGWYVLERTPSEMRVWFWSRGDKAVPAAVKSGAKDLDTAKFGEPGALFPSSQCDIGKHFAAHNIIINLTLCGQWAGQTYNQNGCKGSCVDHVNADPAAFTDAYWNLGAVRVYE